MSLKNKQLIRMLVFGGIFLVICVLYLVKLVNIQITGRDYYSFVKEDTSVRYETIAAQRGEIYDRNGKAVVVNSSSYNLELDYACMPRDAENFNAVILTSIKAVRDAGAVSNDGSGSFPFVGEYPDMSFDTEKITKTTSSEKRFNSLIDELELKRPLTAKGYAEHLAKKFKLVDKDGNFLYSAEDFITLMRVRYDMLFMRFSAVEPYTLTENVDVKTLSAVKERTIAQILVSEVNSRTYCYPGYASHILGRIGKIPAEKYEYYKELDYSLDAIVGVGGVEEAYESYLHGKDGVMKITEDAYGNIISEEIYTQPEPGYDVRLTIDIDMQIAAEDGLRENVALIVEKGKASKDEFAGEDAFAGAVVAMSPQNGEVLAIASYPTYTIEEYVSNYSALAALKENPLYNRALMGIYSPGSTFKPATAAAALSEGVITTDTIIVDKGAYTYYAGYSPRCWLYLTKGRTHGAQNVVQAIQNSCNYFFYETGRRLGIDKLDEYCTAFGLGQYTGIELPEKKGILAGPSSSEDINGTIWNPGNTLQAAIGQSDNSFTPIQLASYISTLINGGTRYRAHLLLSANRYFTGEAVYETPSEVLSEILLKPEIVSTLKSAMKDVTENGSAARLFRNYKYTVGGKTGTAQLGTTGSDNALFVAFAPYESPEIVVSCVIEHGANGTDAGFTVRDIFDCFFAKKEAADANPEDAPIGVVVTGNE